MRYLPSSPDRSESSSSPPSGAESDDLQSNGSTSTMAPEEEEDAATYASGARALSRGPGLLGARTNSDRECGFRAG